MRCVNSFIKINKIPFERDTRRLSMEKELSFDERMDLLMKGLKESMDRFNESCDREAKLCDKFLELNEKIIKSCDSIINYKGEVEM